MTKKWRLNIRTAQRNEEDVIIERKEYDMFYEGDELIDVGRQVWKDHFNYVDINVDDYGTCKLDPIGDCVLVWTAKRNNEIGKFTGIYRLYEE